MHDAEGAEIEFSSGKPVFDSKGNATNSDDCYTTLAYDDIRVWATDTEPTAPEHNLLVSCDKYTVENGVIKGNSELKATDFVSEGTDISVYTNSEFTEKVGEKTLV